MFFNVKGKGSFYIVEFLNKEEEPLGLFMKQDGSFTMDKKEAEHFTTMASCWKKGISAIGKEDSMFKFFDIVRSKGYKK